LKSYYESYNKLIELTDYKNTDLSPYLWRQKSEISSLYGIEPGFWPRVDYLIGLTTSTLKKPKKVIEQNVDKILRPLYEKYNSRLDKIYKKIPEKEYLYLKNDLKTFHHIVAHTINLIDKNFAHFIPSYLFISSIDNMLILSPRYENTINPGFLARNNYRTLLTCHLAGNFSLNLKKSVEFLLWYREVSSLLFNEDKIKYRNQFKLILDKVLKERLPETIENDQTLQHAVRELRGVITSSLIFEKVLDILNDINMSEKHSPLDVEGYLSEIGNIFIPDSIDSEKQNSIIRDLTVIIIILKNIYEAIETSNKNKLFNHINIFLSLKTFFNEITRFLLPVRLQSTFMLTLETIGFIESIFPAMIIEDQLKMLLLDLVKIISKEIDKIKDENTITITINDIHLFLDKFKLLRAEVEKPLLI